MVVIVIGFDIGAHDIFKYYLLDYFNYMKKLICNKKFFPPILIMISFLIFCVIIFISLVVDVCYSVYH